MLLPAICSCRSSPIKTSDLSTAGIFTAAHISAFCSEVTDLDLGHAAFSSVLFFFYQFINTFGIKPEPHLNNPPQTKFTSNPSRCWWALGFIVFLLPVLSSFILPNSGQNQKLKYSKALNNIFIVHQFWPLEVLSTFSRIWEPSDLQLALAEMTESPTQVTLCKI